MSKEKNIKLFVCGDVKAPQRKAGQDAGIDLFMPNLSENFLKDLMEKNKGHPFRWGILGMPNPEAKDQNETGMFLYVCPHQDVLIPTYVKALIPSNMYLRMANKSGVCTNQKLTVGAEVVDSSYEGIMHIHVFNESNEMRFIEFGQKLCQAIPEVIDDGEIEVWYDEGLEQFKEYKNQTTAEKFYENHDHVRGASGFGSNYQDKEQPAEEKKD